MLIRVTTPSEIIGIRQPEVRTRLSLTAHQFTDLSKAAQTILESENLIELEYTFQAEKRLLLQAVSRAWTQCLKQQHHHGLSIDKQEQRDRLLFTLGIRIVRNARKRRERSICMSSSGLPLQHSSCSMLTNILARRSKAGDPKGGSTMARPRLQDTSPRFPYQLQSPPRRTQSAVSAVCRRPSLEKG